LERDRAAVVAVDRGAERDEAPRRFETEAVVGAGDRGCCHAPKIAMRDTFTIE